VAVAPRPPADGGLAARTTLRNGPRFRLEFGIPMSVFFGDEPDLWQLPERLRGLVEAELRERERIVWVGKPKPWRMALQTLPILLFAIPWTAFAIFWMCGAAGFKVPKFDAGPDLFPLFGVPFVLVGLGMLSAPLWAARKAAGTAYVITTERAIVFIGGRGTTIRSFSPDRLADRRRVQFADGSGDLLFGRGIIATDGEGATTFTPEGFIGVRDVKGVEERIERLVASHTAR